MDKIRYLLFDLDGTLTDPEEGITNAVLYALKKFSIYPKTREELHPYIGPPLTWSFQKFHGLTEVQARQAVVWYREYFSQKGLFENRLFPDIPQLLDTLQKKGYTLMVATSKPEEYALQILEHFGIACYFSFVGGNTLKEERPTKAAVIAHIKDNYPDMSGDNTWMIGDRKYDVEGAGAFGIPTAGVLFGYGSREELVTAGASRLANTVADLQKLFA